MNEFIDKKVVITGGNSGIGKGIAKKFDEEGANIVLFGRNETTLKQTCAELKNATYIQGDVSKIADLNHLYSKTGKIDVLIVNAGVAEKRTIDEVDEAFFDHIVDINYKGAYFTVQRALKQLNDGASIILISSVAAHTGYHGHSVYASTKAAVKMLAKSLSADLMDRKIRVNSISPGYVDTPIFDRRKSENPNYVADCSKGVPMGRFGRPKEIAEAALFLSSKRCQYIVGEDLIIDGGLINVHSS